MFSSDTICDHSCVLDWRHNAKIQKHFPPRSSFLHSLGWSRTEWGPVLLSIELGVAKSLLQRKFLLAHLWWCDPPCITLLELKPVNSQLHSVTERDKEKGSEVPMLWLSRGTLWLSSHLFWKNIPLLTKWCGNIYVLKNISFLPAICLNN